MSRLIPPSAREVPGRFYRTPKELWGFRLSPAAGHPQEVARRALAVNAERLGLDGVLTTLHPRRVLRSLGAWHVIFSQRHRGKFVYRAFVTVHMDSARAIYLIKSRAAPRRLLPARDAVRVSATRARARALRSIRRSADSVRAHGHEMCWFPIRTRLHLAHKFRFHRRRPAEDWIVYIDAETGRLLMKIDNLAEASGRALVFEPNPVVALGHWQSLLDADGVPVRRVPVEAYRAARLTGLTGSGRLDGDRATTALTRDRIQRADHDFRIRSHEPGFEEVMTYYHVDHAIRYVESLGYRGRRAIFTEPLQIDARASREDNSYYLPSTKSLGFGTGDVDDAEDGETILHEFGHAVQDAICPDFGQSQEAAAMGEGFGDYFAASFFADQKTGRRRAFLDTVMTWDGILSPHTPNDVPCVRRLDQPTTYESFDHSSNADEHDNGEIWSATLWDIWKAVGRQVADPIIIESHFQLDGYTSFAKAARAILDADRNLHNGRHLAQLRRVFHRRGIGPVD